MCMCICMYIYIKHKTYIGDIPGYQVVPGCRVIPISGYTQTFIWASGYDPCIPDIGIWGQNQL